MQGDGHRGTACTPQHTTGGSAVIKAAKCETKQCGAGGDRRGKQESQAMKLFQQSSAEALFGLLLHSMRRCKEEVCLMHLKAAKHCAKESRFGMANAARRDADEDDDDPWDSRVPGSIRKWLLQPRHCEEMLHK